MAQPQPVARASGTELRQAAVGESTTQLLDDLSSHVRRLDGRVAGIERRLDEVLAELGQLDSRLSTHSSGEAPSPLDGLPGLVNAVEELNQNLSRLDVAVSDGQPAGKKAHMRAVGHDDA